MAEPVNLAVKLAEIIHDAMVYAVREFRGEPQPWQNGNSTAESYARRTARGFLVALEASPDATEAMDWSEQERAVIRQIGTEMELSDKAVIRQALRAYQRDHERRKAGETCVWSGDAQRARDFAGPLAAPEALPEWSLQFSNTPPSVTIWSAIPGHDPRNDCVAYVECTAEQRHDVGEALRRVVEQYNTLVRGNKPA